MLLPMTPVLETLRAYFKSRGPNSDAVVFLYLTKQGYLSQMETINDHSTARKVQETNVTETWKVEAERKKKAVVAEAKAQAKAMKASTSKQDDEDVRLAQVDGK